MVWPDVSRIFPSLYLIFINVCIIELTRSSSLWSFHRLHHLWYCARQGHAEIWPQVCAPVQLLASAQHESEQGTGSDRPTDIPSKHLWGRGKNSPSSISQTFTMPGLCNIIAACYNAELSVEGYCLILRTDFELVQWNLENVCGRTLIYVVHVKWWTTLVFRQPKHTLGNSRNFTVPPEAW